ncbi:hypothetical protein Pint_22481 [Pistacia integerrima]|uniref:Uncharacterized protein n=1 Tax=Pistacia integerrima TaxID=434235 RepID=A0ACC0YMH5_9ROSI|nr:hypothetical protein Pint_22481 [Pistacia integerrima]
MMDRNWIRLPNRLCKEYIDGIKSFMDVAKKCVDKNNQVRCPCVKCKNVFFKPLDVVENHLYKPGISVSYQRWVYHGEKHELGSTSSINHVHKEPQVLTGRIVDDKERHDPYASSSRERSKPQSSNQGDERISLMEGDNFNTIDGWTSPVVQNNYETLRTVQSSSEMSQAAFGKRSRYALEFGACVKPSHCEGEASHEAALRAKIKKQRTKVESQCKVSPSTDRI